MEISREQLARLTAAADELGSARAEFESQMEGWQEERVARHYPSDQALMSLLMWSAIGVLFGVVGCWNAISDGRGIGEALKALVVGLGIFVVIGLWRASKKTS